MSKFKFELGDWSSDGHGVNKTFVIDCSHNEGKMQRAYWKSVARYKFAFNSNLHMYKKEMNLPENDDISNIVEIWVNYQDSETPDTFVNFIKSKAPGEYRRLQDSLGYDVIKGCTDGYIDIDGPEAHVLIILWFASLSLPNPGHYYANICENNLPSFNGWSGIRSQFGCGVLGH